MALDNNNCITNTQEVIKTLRRVTQDLDVLPKQVYLQYNSIVVDMKRNQKYQSFNKYNIPN